MKTNYKGHEINVSREECLGGWDLLYYSVFRLPDEFECLSDFEDSEESIENKVLELKERIDSELSRSDPWGELNAWE